MKTITATKAARGFSEMLDAVERQESFTITREGKPIAEVRPAKQYTLAGLFEVLERLPRDPEWGDDIEAALDEALLPWDK
ncbi:MAG: type II toxin-antitoxin system prevent-host-death family antitoxin [Bifidobacteriaceae bacterium]|nr:type II toxin-antitoxin system prevent-host-death family antitoxin [Bifidobacteriaceae bacterium]